MLKSPERICQAKTSLSMSGYARHDWVAMANPIPLDACA